MASNNFYRNIIFRTCLLALAALFIGWLFFDKNSLVPGIFAMLIFIIQVVELINYLNRTNTKIAFFFDAIRNDDSTLNFPQKTGNKSLNELNASLNKVNELIKNIKFELREQEQYFKTILEQVSIGIISFSKKGNIYLSNSSARTLLGHEHLTHIDQIAQTDRKLYSAIKEMQPGDRKLVSFNGKTGIVQLSLKSTLFKTAQDTFQLVAIQDIKTELETQELESWIKLIRVLTHEIMNTVAPITSLSQTILAYFKGLNGQLPSEKIIANTIKGLEVINERGTGLIGFVETYRKLTRIPQPDKKPVSVAHLFENTVMLIKSEPENENIQVSWEIKPPDLEIVADNKQIAQVLINLLKNSVEALKNQPGGKIILKSEINTDNKVFISVTDNGPGITNELLDKIFIPFFTTKENGSGIGLSLSRQIIQMHGGSLKVDSKPKKTTFTILF
jgi:two-component system, NtrC family, nitrogen regulation sensor histidine kinase NtrY